MYKAIAIDGPGGAGKSTIARIVSDRLNYIYIDTGAMYRAVALYCINNNVDTSDSNAVGEVLDDINIEIKYIDGFQNIFLNGVNVSKEIRTQYVSEHTSKVATIKAVRQKLAQMQREIASVNNVVMDGRDIGTAVLPNAGTKIFLTASVDVRTKRRMHDLASMGKVSDYETLKQEIIDRDERDSTRKEDPLKIAQDAVLIDSSSMSIDEVIEKIINLSKESDK